LERALKFRILNCKGESFGLRFKRWSGDEGPLPFSLAFTLWVLLEGLPIHLLKRSGVEDIISKFRYLLEIDITH